MTPNKTEALPNCFKCGKPLKEHTAILGAPGSWKCPTPALPKEISEEFDREFPKSYIYVGNNFEKDVDDGIVKIKSFLSKIYHQALKEPHKTVNGYCCSCEYDIEMANAILKDKVAQARLQERNEILGKVKLEKKSVDYFPMAYNPTKDELYLQREAVGYNQAVQDLEAIKDKMR